MADDSQVRKPTRWIPTGWNNQGWVNEVDGRIWYLRTLTSGRVITVSMDIDDWLKIPEEERAVKEIVEDEPKRKGRQQRGSYTPKKRRATGKRDLVRKRSSGFFKHQ